VNLHELQAHFFEWVAGSEAIPAAQSAQVVNGGALELDSRVGVYAEMFWLRMLDVLRGDFKKVLAKVGDEAFEVLVANYIKAHPSRHFSLGQLGQHFAEFLVGEDESLAGIAALEWAMGQSFIAANSAVVETEALAAITEETFAHVTLTPTPSVRLVGEVVVWRRGYEVLQATVSADEAAALTSLLAGVGDLPTLCEPFTEPSAAFTAIASWVNEGMIARLVVRSGV
jgi:hypothetical protein